MTKDIKSFKDEDLVILFKDGNEQAFDELYLRYAPKLKKLIYNQLGKAHELEDVLHEVFLRVYKHIETYNTELAFSSWIYKIAVNCSKNYWKKSMRNDTLIEREKESFDKKKDSFSPENLYIDQEDMEEFYCAVDNLKEKFKTVFLLRFDHSLPYSEIAEITKCSERTAKWRMQRAIETIVDYLKDKSVI